MGIIQNLQWDSTFFNMKCGKVIIDDKFSKWNELYEDVKKYNFVTIQNIGNKIYNNEKIALIEGVFLADLNIQFEKEVQHGSEEINCKIYSCVDVPRELFESAKVYPYDFVFSKFECDSRLKKMNGYKVYEEWLKNSKGDASKFVTFYLEDGICGFILFCIECNEARIELIKVEREFQKKGIATKMIKHLEKYLSKNNIEILKVGTQVNNLGAINLYHHIGFKEVLGISVYHYWNNVPI